MINCNKTRNFLTRTILLLVNDKSIISNLSNFSLYVNNNMLDIKSIFERKNIEIFNRPLNQTQLQLKIMMAQLNRIIS